MRISKSLSKEKVILTVKNMRGEFEQLDILGKLNSNDYEEQRLRAFLKNKKSLTWDIRGPHSETFPEGRILEGCSIGQVREDIDGYYSVDISWTSERSLTKMIIHWHRLDDGTIVYES